MDNQKLKILVACHKDDPEIRREPPYLPIQVGKELHPEVNLGFQCDNEGENISSKNASYCELTAMYWGWKNLPKDIEYVGLAHYRRYFDLEENQIESVLKKYDWILPKPVNQASSNLNNLIHFIGQEDAYILLDTLIDLYPSIKKNIIDYFLNDNHYSVFNMFIAKRKNFDEYCLFLFKVLEETEKRIKKYNGYTRQNRKIGYMAELLLGLWINYVKPKVKYVKTTQVHALKGSFKYEMFKKIRPSLYNLAFRLQNIPRNRNIYPLEAVKIGLKTDGYNLRNF